MDSGVEASQNIILMTIFQGKAETFIFSWDTSTKVRKSSWMEETRLQCLGKCARHEMACWKPGLGKTQWVSGETKMRKMHLSGDWRQYSDIQTHRFDILSDLKELCNSSGFKNVVLPPRLGRSILDQLIIGAWHLGWGHVLARLVQFVECKHCAHGWHRKESRDDNKTPELFKMLVELHICTCASQDINQIGMWFDFQNEIWLTFPFHNIDCHEINGFPWLK